MKIPFKTKAAVAVQLMQVLDEYFEEAEVWEDDEVLQNPDVQKRFDDFVEWFCAGNLS